MLDIGVLSVTILAMIIVGMEMEVAQLRKALRSRGQLLIVVAGQALVLPAIALLLAGTLSLAPEVSAGLLLVAACPVGNIANFYTLLARANLALSVVTNALSCLLSFATMYFITEVPLALAFVAAYRRWSPQFDMKVLRGQPAK